MFLNHKRGKPHGGEFVLHPQRLFVKVCMRMYWSMAMALDGVLKRTSRFFHASMEQPYKFSSMWFSSLFIYYQPYLGLFTSSGIIVYVNDHDNLNHR